MQLSPELGTETAEEQLKKVQDDLSVYTSDETEAGLKPLTKAELKLQKKRTKVLQDLVKALARGDENTANRLALRYHNLGKPQEPWGPALIDLSIWLVRFFATLAFALPYKILFRMPFPYALMKCILVYLLAVTFFDHWYYFFLFLAVSNYIYYAPKVVSWMCPAEWMKEWMYSRKLIPGLI